MPTHDLLSKLLKNNSYELIYLPLISLFATTRISTHPTSHSPALSSLTNTSPTTPSTPPETGSRWCQPGPPATPRRPRTPRPHRDSRRTPATRIEHARKCSLCIFEGQRSCAYVFVCARACVCSLFLSVLQPRAPSGQNCFPSSSRRS